MIFAKEVAMPFAAPDLIATTPLLSSADYKPCTCLAKAPTRACRMCLDTHWLKRCPSCFADGLIYKQVRQHGAQPRTERCGFCMGAGWIPCPKREIPAGVPEPTAAPQTPPPAQTARRIAARRTQIRKSKPKRLGTQLPSISVERPQNPAEAKELYERDDNPADPLANEVTPGSFAPDDLPPAAA